MTFLRKSCLLVEVWMKSLATAASLSFCSGSRSHGTNFAMTRFMPRSCLKILDAVVSGISGSASSSHTVSLWSLLIATRTHSTSSGVLLLAGLLEHRSHSTDSRPSLEHSCHIFYLHCTHSMAPKAFWIWIISTEECSSLVQNVMQILLSTHSVILNVTASQCTCSLSSVPPPPAN